MSKKKTIRIIKKGENTREIAKPKVDSPREVVGTVTNWLKEFQQKRGAKTRVRF